MISRKLLAVSVVAVMLSACSSMQKLGLKSSESDSQKTASVQKPSTPAGMNDKGEVINSSEIQSGTGQKVTGLSDTEGEVWGKPAAGSKFTKLKIGMTQNAVRDIVGSPSDQSAHATGKGWIPFYMGGDAYRHEWVYKGQGRLVFTGGGMTDMTSRLIQIIHNKNEEAYM